MRSIDAAGFRPPSVWSVLSVVAGVRFDSVDIRRLKEKASRLSAEGRLGRAEVLYRQMLTLQPRDSGSFVPEGPKDPAPGTIGGGVALLMFSPPGPGPPLETGPDRV